MEATVVAIVIAVLIFVVAWIVIGIIPFPANLTPLRTVLYVLAAVVLILYLLRFLPRG